MNGRPSRRLPRAKPVAVGAPTPIAIATACTDVGAGEDETQVAADAHRVASSAPTMHAGAEDRPEQVEPGRAGGSAARAITGRKVAVTM